MLDVYSGFEPALVSLIGKADPESLKVWALLDMDIIPTWVNDRLALLGDAAHPFTPRESVLVDTRLSSEPAKLTFLQIRAKVPALPLKILPPLL